MRLQEMPMTPPSLERRAIIDVGTNSVKLLVGDVQGACVTPVLESSIQTRLGKDFYKTRRLTSAAVSRTEQAVSTFLAQAKEAGAGTVHAIGTSAAREALNVEELREKIAGRCGIRLEVISGEQEAQWMFEGIRTEPALQNRRTFILDAGGGSTQMTVGGNGASWRCSLPIGGVRLLEQVHPADPPTSQDRITCRERIREVFSAELSRCPPPRETVAGASWVGTGGTAAILGRIERQVDSYDREAIEGARLSQADIGRWADRLWSLPLVERRRVRGMPSDRADVIIMGVAIYEWVAGFFGFETLRISTRGLRFGALLALR